MSDVSVVIPTFNCAQYLPDAIQSVLSQSQAPSEIIVVDDGSVDHTEAVMKVYPDVLYVRQENGGPAKARNTGIKNAKADYVAFLDADDFWLPDKLSKQTSLLDSYPAAGFAFSVPWNVSDSADPKIPSEPYCPPVLEAWARHQAVTEDFAFGSAYRLLLENNCVATSSVMVRRDALLEVGFFDESMRGYEDYDLWLRLARTRLAIFMRAPVSRYRIQTSGLSGNWDARSERFYNYCIRVVEKEWRARPSYAARRAVANYYASYAYFLLCRSRREDAVDASMKSVATFPGWKAMRVLAEATFPSTFAWAAAMRKRHPW
jgi:glycosyltransferase involved in cell wall biosynthesis